MTAAEVTGEIPVVLTGFTTRVRRRVTGTVRRRVCQGPGSLSVQPSATSAPLPMALPPRKPASTGSSVWENVLRRSSPGGPIG